MRLKDTKLIDFVYCGVVGVVVLKKIGENYKNTKMIKSLWHYRRAWYQTGKEGTKTTQQSLATKKSGCPRAGTNGILNPNFDFIGKQT
jgi:hypothetical protein